MKRSGNVGLVLMGGAAFAATFAAGMAYFAWQKPGHAAQPQAAAAAQNCTTGPDGTQTCQTQRRSFAYYLLPSFSFGSSRNASSAPDPRQKTQSAALTNSSRAYTPAPNTSGTVRGGFGSTVQSGSYRSASAGG
jgi:hypothetical protein